MVLSPILWSTWEVTSSVIQPTPYASFDYIWVNAFIVWQYRAPSTPACPCSFWWKPVAHFIQHAVLCSCVIFLQLQEFFLPRMQRSAFSIALVEKKKLARFRVFSWDRGKLLQTNPLQWRGFLEDGSLHYRGPPDSKLLSHHSIQHFRLFGGVVGFSFKKPICGPPNWILLSFACHIAMCRRSESS